MKKLTLVLSASLALFCAKSQAHPYASGVTNNAGTITFHLNESVTNGQVYVLFDSGSVSNVPAGIPNNGSNVPRGVYSFALGAHTNYSINIFNIGTGTPAQISPNPAAGSVATNFDYFAPRGVSVNKNPKSPYFGTVYISNGNAGNGNFRTGFTKGVYAIHADGSDRFGYGNAAMPPIGSGTDGATTKWGGSTVNSALRIFVGPDDMVYVSDGGTATIGAGVWMISPDLKQATSLFPYNGATAGGEGIYNSCQGVNVRGSYAAGNLDVYTIEWDRSPYQSVWYYKFYDDSTTPATPLTLPWDVNNNFPAYFASDGACPDIYGYGQNNPNNIVNAGISSINGVTCDFFLGPDGRFYCVEARNAPSGTGNQGFWVYDAATNGACLLYDGLDSTPGGNGPAAIWGANSVTVSDDNQYIAFGTTTVPTNSAGKDYYGTGSTTRGDIVYTTFGGPQHLPIIPPSAITYHPGVNCSVNGTTFDSANNVYGVSGSDDSLRAFTLGLTTLTSYSNDSTGTNGSFTVSTPGSSVSVTATQPTASQNHGSPTQGVFTFTRTGNANAISQPLTVNFSLTGTATQAPWTSPAAFTASSSSSVTFAAGQTTATVTITPSNDNVSRPTLTVIATVLGSQVYSVTPPSSATISIVNTGPQMLSVSTGSASTMYRGLAKDYATATITRWGDTNAATYTVPSANFTYGGTAQQTTDYTAFAQPLNVNGAVNGGADLTINPGDVSVTAMVGNPVATANYVGDKTILLGLNSGGGYTAATNKATLTILDNHYQNEQVIWSNALTSASDSTNWLVAFGGEGTYTVTFPNYNNNPAASGQDFDVEFGYNLANDGVGPAPNGATTGLKATVNKNGTNKKAGVCVYPQGVNLSGDYAIRFSMNMVRGTTGTTEYTQFGINHYGTNEAWWAGEALIAGGVGNTNIDGVWYSLCNDQGGATANSLVNDFMAMVGQPLPNTGWTSARPPQSASGYANYFKHPVPYAAGAAGYGTPATQFGGDESAWTDVEIAQSNSIVTLSLNRTPIFVYTNKLPANGGNTGGGVYTSGVPMLGHSDPFKSVGVGGATYYSNIRAVSLGSAALVAPKITNVSVAGGNVVITFTTTATADTAANFTVQAEPAVLTAGNTWADVAPAANITGGSGSFTATLPVSGTTQFYRIKR